MESQSNLQPFPLEYLNSSTHHDSQDTLIIEISMDTVGQRIFSEIVSTYYQVPLGALRLQFNITHHEFSAMNGDKNSMYYLASNTSDRRWAIQYVDTVAYGPNPWRTHERLVEMLMERNGEYKSRLVAVALNTGCAQWEQIEFPQHVRENTFRYNLC